MGTDLNTIRNWLGALMLFIGLMANAAAMPVVMHFTFSGFYGSPPTTPVTGTITWDAPSLNDNINYIASITLTLGGHTYTVPEVGYYNNAPYGIIGGVVHGPQSASAGTDDFLLMWNRSTLQPQDFTYGTASTAQLWSAETFNSFSITEGVTVGGTVTGLGSGKAVVLQNNGGSGLTVSANGSFNFVSEIGAGYVVTVLTQPTGQTCRVSNGSGTANSNVTNVAVSCTDNPVAATTPVPTLSEWAQYVLALMLLLAGGWYLRRTKDRG
jgi:hypothetical protein